jgi:hypothetical protein
MTVKAEYALDMWGCPLAAQRSMVLVSLPQAASLEFALAALTLRDRIRRGGGDGRRLHQDEKP